MLTVYNPNQLLDAGMTAEAKPNTIIAMRKGTYLMPRPLYLRNGAQLRVDDGVKLLCGFHFQGGEPGIPLIIGPRLRGPVKLAGQNSGGWWCVEPDEARGDVEHSGGAVIVAERMARRWGMPKDTSPFREFAPCEPAHSTTAPLSDLYDTFIGEDVPSVGAGGVGVRVTGLHIGFDDPQSDQGIRIYRGQNVTLDGCTIDDFTSASQGSMAGIEVTSSHNVSISLTRTQRLEINSSNYVDVINSNIFYLGLEECAFGATIKRNIINRLRCADSTCENIRIMQNVFRGLQQDFGSAALAGGVGVEFIGNECDDYVQLGQLFRAGHIRRNRLSGIYSCKLADGSIVNGLADFSAGGAPLPGPAVTTSDIRDNF
jgi:hypothetical protein